MSREAACDLSIPDLLRALNEKLGLKHARFQKTPLSLAMSAALLESEVSEPQLAHFNERDGGV